MSTGHQPLIPATIETNSEGALVSPRFDDIYHAGASPFQQAFNVFLRGNGLPERWRGMSRFTILETGFGLGHNFLATWQAWRNDTQRPARLHFVSIEAYPLRQPDLAAQLARMEGPEEALGRELLNAWPVLLPGVHRLEFEGGAVTLTLAFGRVLPMARQLDLGFDACFLDGFSPRTNPDMWAPEVFGQLARLAYRNATLATWCSAGQVRRDLQAAGFLIRRESGFDGKRHRITGLLRPNLGQTRQDVDRQSVIVVGSGFAGASIAHALARRGHAVSVLDPALAAGTVGTHRHHRVAALTPALSRDNDIRSRLSRAGVLLAMLRWNGLPGQARPARMGSFEPVPEDDAQGWMQALDRLGFPDEWVRWVSATQASRLTGIPIRHPGLWHAFGHTVRPEPLLDALLCTTGVVHHALRVDSLTRAGDGQWRVHDENGKILAAAGQLVLATSGLTGRLLAGVPGLEFPQRLCTLHQLAGQLSYFDGGVVDAPRTMLAADGLCFPEGPQSLTAGSTYVTQTALSIITKCGHRENRKKVAQLLNIHPSQLGHVRTMADGWAGWRAAVRDRLPVIGPIATEPGLWLACGFGSRGLTWSALAAELIAARVDQEPVPLERELSRKIAPV